MDLILVPMYVIIYVAEICEILNPTLRFVVIVYRSALPYYIDVLLSLSESRWNDGRPGLT